MVAHSPGHGISVDNMSASSMCLTHLCGQAAAVVQGVVEGGRGRGGEVSEACHGRVQVLHPRHRGGEAH